VPEEADPEDIDHATHLVVACMIGGHIRMQSNPPCVTFRDATWQVDDWQILIGEKAPFEKSIPVDGLGHELEAFQEAVEKLTEKWDEEKLQTKTIWVLRTCIQHTPGQQAGCPVCEGEGVEVIKCVGRFRFGLCADAVAIKAGLIADK
jgi:hypothetical protein